MHVLSEGAINLLAIPVRILNQPMVKENIKNVAGALTCAFGLIEMYDLYQILRSRSVSVENGAMGAMDSQTNQMGIINTLHKIAIVCAKISLILSAGVSRPGVFIISSLAGCVFSTSQLNRLGPNTTFAINPWHPRHLASIAAVILALPALAQSAYQGVNWAYKKIRQHQDAPGNASNTQQSVEQNRYLTDAKVRLINLFNTITSRPILHLGNQLCRSLIRLMRTSPM